MRRVISQFLAFGIISLAAAFGTSAQTAYSYSRSITINHTEVPNSDQSNFPVLISGTYPFLATTANGGDVTNANGYDIVFTSDAAGNNVLPFERESYNSSTGTVIFWVQVPTVSHTADTVFYMFYGNASVTTDPSNKTGAWDSNYLGVWHLPNGSTLSASDSTSNGKNGTVNGASAVAGEIDGGASFNGSSNDVDIPAYKSSVSSFTISTWIYLKAAPNAYTGIVYSRDPSEPVGMTFLNSSADLGYTWNNGSSQTYGWNSGLAIRQNQWAYAVIVISPSQTVATVCSNGSCNSATNAVANNSQTLNTDFLFANDSCCSGRWLNANLDEVRISKVARSQDWITAEYNNQNNPASFYSVGSQNGGSGGPTISLSLTSGLLGTSVTVTGSGLGSAQGSSAVTFNGVAATPTSWSATSIVVAVPSGATSGPVIVTVSGVQSNYVNFTVQTVPTSWSDQDVSVVGLTGSATYTSGVFTVQGSGGGITSTSDGLNFVNQTLSGDGTIVARVVSLQGSSTAEAGVMIRETLNANATEASTVYSQSDVYFLSRTTTGGNTGYYVASGPLPRWVKLVRSGSTFSSYESLDGVNWVQVGSSVTITMAQNVYIGLAVSSQSNSVLATATVDSVSITSSNSTPSVISGLSATTGSIGSQVTISGSGFGASQAGSVVLLNDTLATINSWSNTALSITIPSGATSGPLVVSIAPTMNASNPVEFEVTSQPLPTSWLDQDISAVGIGGTATFMSGVFTVQGSGTGITGTSDSMHFVYLPLSGDGTIVARVISLSSNGAEAGVMIRETLNANATEASTVLVNGVWTTFFLGRSTTGGNTSQYTNVSSSLPYWLELVRSGNTFSSYVSTDGVNWFQMSTSQTITMAQNVYIGLAVASGSNSSLATATFDSVSISSATSQAPVISGLSPTTGSVGSQVAISGSGFGASQAGSIVTLNGTVATINSWSNTAISFAVPTGATTGNVVVYVAPSMNASNPFWFEVTTQPLALPWLDQDISAVGLKGGATFANGVFMISGAGTGITGTSDELHFVYQPLSGDGTIVARVISVQGSSNAEAGVMIRETLNGSATEASTLDSSSLAYFFNRSTTGGGTTNSGSISAPLTYWVELVRTGNTFSSYASPDGVNWTQIGSTQTITMAQNVYIGLAVSSQSNSALATALFDNVSITTPSTPLPPAISGISPSSGPVGSAVTINGSNFGTTRGTSVVQFNGVVAAISSWTSTSISATVPSPATTGPVVVTVNGENSNAVTFTAITTGTLSGTITDSSSGNPISGAQIQVRQLGGVKATTSSGSSGSYSVSSLTGGSYDVQVSASGYGTSLNSPVSVPAGVTTTLNVSLSAPGTISGVVTQSDGVTPISGATVQALVGQASADSATTNSTGAYTLSGLSAGSYNVTAYANGYIASTQSESVTANSTTTANFSLQAQGTAGTIQYVYDALGRLVGVISPSGDTAIYNYDAVGNLLSISRQSSSQLSIITFTPPSATVGASVTIFGTGFSTTTAQDTVTFNGTAATVQSATSTQLVVTVPTGATSGPISVTTSASSVTSGASFTVINQ